MKKEKLYGKEVFQLSLRSTNVFLEVCDIIDNNINKVRVRELETYEHNGYDMLKLAKNKKKFKVCEESLLPNNEYTYYIEDGQFKMPIEIHTWDRLYIYDSVVPGIYYAEMIGDGSKDAFSELAHTAFEKITSSSDIHWS